MRTHRLPRSHAALPFITLLLVVSVACAPRGPVIDTGAKPPGVGGTISGTVRGPAGSTPLSGRKVTATNVVTGVSFDTSTAANGGYTMKVTVGKYRLDVELRAGEVLDKRPDDLEIKSSDVDAQRNFVVTVRPGYWSAAPSHISAPPAVLAG